MGKKKSNILLGACGEYYVAAELSKRGYIASMTHKNSPSVDIIASDVKGSKSINIQVKTKSTDARAWHLSLKNEDNYSSNLFYVLVELKEKGLPNYYIYRSKEIAKLIKKRHLEYIKKPKKDGNKRKDWDLRFFRITEEKEIKKHLNNFELLGLGG